VVTQHRLSNITVNRIDKVPITQVRMSPYLRYILRPERRPLVENGVIHMSLANIMDKSS
jgi:hypothetical protein